MSTAERRPAAGGRAASPADQAAYQTFVRQQRATAAAVRATQTAMLVLGVYLWHLSARHYWINPLFTSSPQKVWTTLLHLIETGGIWRHAGVTLQETVVSFGIGMSLGIVAAVVLWWSPFVSRVCDPFLVVLNATPRIAFGPILYVLFGDGRSIYAMAVLISVVVTIIMVHTGFKEVDAQKIKLLRTFGASRRQILTKVVLPASIPTMVGALKVNVGLTLVGVIVGEFINSKAGLGYLIQYGSQVFQMELVMAAILVLVLMSALLYLAVKYIEDLVLRRRPQG